MRVWGSSYRRPRLFFKALILPFKRVAWMKRLGPATHIVQYKLHMRETWVMKFFENIGPHSAQAYYTFECKKMSLLRVRYWSCVYFPSVEDPGSGAFLTPGSGIRNRIFPDPGSQNPYLWELVTILSIGSHFFPLPIQKYITFNFATFVARKETSRIRNTDFPLYLSLEWPRMKMRLRYWKA